MKGKTESSIGSRLDAACEEHANEPAVVDDDRVVTYREIWAQSNRLAHALSSVGVGPGHRVGMLGPKSIEIVAALYGVLRAGAAYVPLDPKAPRERLAYIASNCQLEVIVSAGMERIDQAYLASSVEDLRHIVMVDDEAELDDVAVIGAGEVADMPEDHPAVAVDPDALAYVLYTSGSTGYPKGVMLTHRNGLAFVDWAVNRLGLRASDRLSSHAPFHFDLSVFDLFGACSVGASVHLVPSMASVFPTVLASFIRAHRLSVWYSVPSVLSMLVERGALAQGDLPTLRELVFAGEVFPTRYLSELMRLLPHARFHNWYGPTETNVCTAYQVPSPPDPDEGDIPIGMPIDGVEALVVDDEGLSIEEPGTPGELWVRGPTVMQGYWGDDARTNARMAVPSGVAGPSYFKTGDIVEWSESGDLRFLGRLDHQIKSRGYRIELGEIESALYRVDAVKECAVVAIPDDLISNRIRAIIAATGSTSRSDIVEAISRYLPAYMIPDEFVFMEELPKTSTGKIDRPALEPR